MTFRVEIQPRARADTVEAFRWIADRSPAAAARWFAGLTRALDTLKHNPERHPVAVEESERFTVTIREALYGRRAGVFRILFTVEGDLVSVLAIRHSARGPAEP